MHFLAIKRMAACALLFLSLLPAAGQDLIASQAPIDRKLKAVDSVALQRLLQAESNAADDLYDSWNTASTHCYSAAELPDSFKIDLRGFSMPTPSRNITSRFGYRPAFRRMHKGLDVKVYTGDTIYAAFAGKVRIAKYDGGGYGYYIVLRHDNGLETIYGHLSKQLVGANDEVRSGEPIGLGGNTGRSFGSHLHFETRLLGEAINPELLFDFPAQDVTADYFVYHNPNTQRHPASGLDREEYTPRYAAATQSESTSRKGKREQAASHFYQVRKGDNLYSIARSLGISVDKLCATNNLSPRARIRPKQILKY